jgi:hypothetical protein
MPSTIGIVAGGVWTPLELSPDLWLDAADTSTITASGSPLRVSQINDKSGNGRNLAQSNGANQPVSGATTINGLNVLDFTGGRRLARTDDAILQDVAGGTAFVVVKGTYSTADPGGVIFLITANNTTANARSGLIANSGAIRAAGRRLDANTLQFVASGSTTNDVSYLVGGVFDYANADLNVRLNGVSTTRSGGFQTAGNTSNTSSRILLGADGSGTISYTGSVAEVIVLSRLATADEISLIEEYLRSKWAVY